MAIGTTISASKTLLQVGQEIAKVMKKAQKSQESPDVTKTVLFYLESAQAAISALELERQCILTDVLQW